MTVVIATVEAGKVHVIADTGCVLGDTVIQSDCKLRQMKLAGEPCIVGLAGSGSGLEQAEALLAGQPFRDAPGRSGACGGILYTMRTRKVAKDDTWEVLVAFGTQQDRVIQTPNPPEVYIITKDGMTGPTQRGAIGCGATAGLAALYAVCGAAPGLQTIEGKLETAVCAANAVCEGVVGGPGQVLVL